MGSPNRKRIKLFGGPRDGLLIDIPYDQMQYQVTHMDGDGSQEFIYNETPRRATNGEVIFSCYDYMFELP